jgi:hypothetical protein
MALDFKQQPENEVVLSMDQAFQSTDCDCPSEDYDHPSAELGFKCP